MLIANVFSSCVVPKRKTGVKIRAIGIFPGATVTRGRDWNWGDQDGGQGSEGEVKGYQNMAPDSSRNLVIVDWSNGTSNYYRLGFQGQVDLTCVEEEVGPYYYRDHLATLEKAPEESGDIFCCEDFVPGDKVTIRVGEEKLKELQKTAGGCTARMVRIRITGKESMKLFKMMRDAVLGESSKGHGRSIGALFAAINMGADDDVRDMCQRDPSLDRFEDTPLHIAIEQRKDKALEALVSLPEVNINIGNTRDFDAIQLASLMDNTRALELLLARDTSGIERLRKGHSSALTIAASNDHVECIRLLVFNTEEAEVEVACRVQIATMLITRGAYVDAENHQGRHPFLYGVSQVRDGIKTFMKHKVRAIGIFPGATVTRGKDWVWDDQDGGPGSEGEVTSYENASVDSSRCLVNVQWSSGLCNSYRLGFQGRVDLKFVEEEVKKIGAGDVVRIKPDEEQVKLFNTRVGWKPEMAATLNKVGKVIKVDQDGDLLVTFNGCHYLYSPACCTLAPGATVDSVAAGSPQTGDTTKDTKVTSPGASEEKGDKQNMALFRMVRDMVIGDSAGSKSQGRTSMRALFGAIEMGDDSAVREMCQKDGTMLEREVEDLTPLIYATLRGKRSCVEALLELGADVNVADEDGDTPLHLCIGGKIEGSDVTLQPCQHRSVCSTCMDKVKQCPLCEEQVTEKIITGPDGQTVDAEQCKQM
nr:hypothetical protein BaRGS_005277 [Batillaria attramentaria]